MTTENRIDRKFSIEVKSTTDEWTTNKGRIIPACSSGTVYANRKELAIITHYNKSYSNQLNFNSNLKDKPEFQEAINELKEAYPNYEVSEYFNAF